MAAALLAIGVALFAARSEAQRSPAEPDAADDTHMADKRHALSCQGERLEGWRKLRSVMQSRALALTGRVPFSSDARDVDFLTHMQTSLASLGSSVSENSPGELRREALV